MIRSGRSCKSFLCVHKQTVLMIRPRLQTTTSDVTLAGLRQCVCGSRRKYLKKKWGHVENDYPTGTR